MMDERERELALYKKKAHDWNAEADRYLSQRDELLVALKAAEQFLSPEIDRGPASDGWANTVQMVHDAIAKAEGHVKNATLK